MLSRYVNNLGDFFNTDPESIKGFYQADSVFGRQLVCVAEYYLGEAYPFNEGKTEGTYAQDFIDTYNPGWQGQRFAWCAIFPWYAMQAACQALGLTNVFPGYNQAWGSARLTAEKCSKLFPKSNVKAGTIFYRKSKAKNSSGHMGIVSLVDEENQQFYTIEGNIRYSPGVEGLGSWVYDFKDIQTYQFVFFDVGQYANYRSVPATVAYNNYECTQRTEKIVKAEISTETDGDYSESEDIYIPDCIVVTTGPNGLPVYSFTYKGITYGAAKGKGTYNWYINLDTTGNGTNYTPLIILDNGECSITIPQGGGQTNVTIINASTDAQKKVLTSTDGKATGKIPACVHLEIPTGEGINHFTLLKDYNVVADIFGCSKGWHGITEAARNGSALWYHGQDKDPGKHTGFGIFKDDIGNDYYVIDGASSAGMSFMQSKYLEKLYPFIITLNGRTGSGSYEAKADNLMNFSDPPNMKSYFVDSGLAKYFKDNNAPILENAEANGILKNVSTGLGNVYYLNVYNFIKKINDSGLKLTDAAGNSRPIVFHYSKDDVGKKNFYENIHSMCTIAASIMKLIPVYGTIIGGAIQEVGQIIYESSQGHSVLQIGFSQGAALLRMANMIAPDTIKGIADKVDEVGTNIFGPILRSAREIIAPSSNGGNLSQDYDAIAKQLQVTSNWVSNMLISYTEDVTAYGGLIAKFGGKDLKNLYNQILNAKNMYLIRHVNSQMESGFLKQTLIGNGQAATLSTNPIMQDVFISGATQTVFQAMPGTNIPDNTQSTDEPIAATILDRDNPAWQYEISGLSKKSEIQASLIAQANGYYPIKNGYEEINILALQNKAKEFEKNKIPFIMPESIPPEKRECYEFELKAAGVKNLITCKDGEMWDPALKKCVMEKTSIIVCRSDEYWDPNQKKCVSSLIKKDEPPPAGSGNVNTTIPGGVNTVNSGGLNVKLTPSGGVNTNSGGGNVNTTIPGGVNTVNTGGGNITIIPSGGNNTVKTSGGNNNTVVPGKLPPCIKTIGNKFYYTVPDSNQNNTLIASLPVSNPAATQQVSLPVSGQLGAIPVNSGNSVNLPPGTVANVPAGNTLNLPLVNLPSSSVKNSGGNAFISPPLNVLSGSPGIGVANAGMIAPVVPAATSTIHLSDNIYEAVVQNAGSLGEKWFAIVNGEYIEIGDDCKLKIKTTLPGALPVPTPVLPPCIEILNGKYYFAKGGLYYEAGQDPANGKWYTNYKGVNTEIINCDVKEPVPDLPKTTQPVIPDNPTPKVPDNPPQQPVDNIPFNPLIPTIIPKIPDNPTPKVPENPPPVPTDNVPVNPLIPIIPPKIPVTETLPDCITLMNGDYIFTPKSKTPVNKAYGGLLGSGISTNEKAVIYPAYKDPATGKWYAEINGVVKEIINCDVIEPVTPPPPSIPNPVSTKKDGDCGCDQPKMVEEYKKTYFQYPPNMPDDGCCEE